jgi:hypothetical protein
MKKYIFYFCLLLISISASAQSVTFSKTDGTTLSFNLNNVPKITFNNNKVQVYAINGNTTELDINNIQYYKYNQSSITTSIDDLKVDKEFYDILLYPIPIDNILNINYSLKKNSDIKIKIMDLIGNQIGLYNYGTQVQGQHNIKIELEGLSPGVYIIELQNQNKSVHNKIIKK